MRALLHDLRLTLESDDEALLDGWRRLFDIEVGRASTLPSDVVPDIALTAVVLSQLPQIAAGQPSYIDPLPEGGRRVRYHETSGGGILDLARPARIHFDFLAGQARILLTRSILDTGNLEDVTMIALAPFLRRRSFYMAHAFAVSGDTAVLLSAPSGGAKTTTGLALVQQGARYLANDVTLLRSDGDLIKAYLSPGAVNVHPHTLSLLPDFRERLPAGETAGESGKIVLSRDVLFESGQLGDVSPVKAILFSSITEQSDYSLHDVPAAVGMARLIEEGVDQWDGPAHDDHISFLAALSRQVHFYDLRLPATDPDGLRHIAGGLAQTFL
jgi:hypothetical protein